MDKDIYVFIDQHNKPYSYDLVIDDEYGHKLAEEKGHEYCGIFNTKQKPLILGKDYELKHKRALGKINYRELSCPLYLPFDYSNASGAHRSDFKFMISVSTRFGVNANVCVVLENGLSNQLWGKDNKSKFRVIENNNLLYLVFLDEWHNQTSKAVPLKFIGD